MNMVQISRGSILCVLMQGCQSMMTVSLLFSAQALIHFNHCRTTGAKKKAPNFGGKSGTWSCGKECNTFQWRLDLARVSQHKIFPRISEFQKSYLKHSKKKKSSVCIHLPLSVIGVCPEHLYVPARLMHFCFFVQRWVFKVHSSMSTHCELLTRR